jgi:hypothetical protein
MTISVLGLGVGLQWFSRQCGARLFSGSALVLLIVASAMAGTKPSRPTASGPADLPAAINSKCPAAVVVKDQPIGASQSVPASEPAADALTTAVGDVADDSDSSNKTPDDPDSSKTEIVQDKLWSTSLSRSSKNDAPMAPQCGTRVPVQRPAN